MPKICDHTSVGVILTDDQNRVLLILRAKFPSGYAAPAGHVDNHGALEQTAVGEDREEVGFDIPLSDLWKTKIANKRVDLPCRRPGGNYHDWTVYEIEKYSGRLDPDERETKGANWHTREQVQELAERTRQYQAGAIGEAEWQQDPGLEPVWLLHFVELGYVT